MLICSALWTWFEASRHPQPPTHTHTHTHTHTPPTHPRTHARTHWIDMREMGLPVWVCMRVMALIVISCMLFSSSGWCLYLQYLSCRFSKYSKLLTQNLYGSDIMDFIIQINNWKPTIKAQYLLSCYLMQKHPICKRYSLVCSFLFSM